MSDVMERSKLDTVPKLEFVVTEEKKPLPWRQAIADAINLQADRHGTGDGNGLVESMDYHNAEHVLDMVGALYSMVEKAIAEGKMTVRQAEVLLTAAAWHDEVQGKKDLKTGENKLAGTNEKESAVMLREWMSSRAQSEETDVYTEDEIEDAVMFIMGTQVRFDKNGMVQLGQEMVLDGWKRLAMDMMMDADLANIGMPWEEYIQRSLNLAKEMSNNKDLNLQSMTTEAKLKFYGDQLKFVEGREYKTDYARQVLPNLDSNRERLRYEINELKKSLNQTAEAN